MSQIPIQAMGKDVKAAGESVGTGAASGPGDVSLSPGALWGIASGGGRLTAPRQESL